MEHVFRSIISILTFFLIMITGLVSCGGGGDASGTDRRAQFMANRGQGGTAEAVPVEVTTVRRDSIADFILKNTALEAERSVDILAKSTGFVEQLFVEEGMKVGKNQVLAEMEDAEQKIALQEAEIALENARMNFERSEKMVKDNLISKEAFENSKFQFEQAQAQLDRAQLNLEYTKIRAPFSGTIIARLINIGDMVRTNVATFSISDYSTLLARIYIPERDIRKISINQPATVTSQVYPEKKFYGKVRLINPAVDAESGTVKVTVELKGYQDVLQPGMFCAVTLVTEMRPNAVVVPKKALVLESQEDMVFVFEDGVAKRRLVKVGLKDVEKLEILAGLEVGEEVITVGQEGLRDGSPVNAIVRDNGKIAEENPAMSQNVRGDRPGSAAASGETRGTEGAPDRKEVAMTAEARHNSQMAVSQTGPDNSKGGQNLSMVPDDRLDEILAYVFSSHPSVKAEYEQRVKQNPELRTNADQKREFLNEMMQKVRESRAKLD